MTGHIGPRAMRRFVVGVGMLFACLYALSIGRGFYSSDGEVMFQTTAALVERHTFELAHDPGLPQIVPGQRESSQNAWYSKYDPGLSLLMVPFYVAGDWVATVNAAHRAHIAATAVLFVPALAAGSALAASAWIALRIAPQRSVRAASRSALWAVLAAGLASPLWWYGRVLFAEAVLAAALTWSAALLLRPGDVYRRRMGLGRVFAAGIVAGIGTTTRAAFAVYVPALVWLVWSGADRNRKAALRQSVVFVLGLLPGATLLLAHNALRFGDGWQFGYAGEGFNTPLLEGATGLLVSPGKGIAWHAPPLLVSVLLWPRLRRIAPRWAWFFVLIWAPALLLYGAWWAWDGGWSWGPRFLVPLIPLSALPLVMLPDCARWRLVLALLVLAGFGVNFAALWVDIVPHYATLAESDGAAAVKRAHWHLADSLPIAAWDRLLHGHTEPLGVFHLNATGLPPTWYVGFPLALMLGGAAGAACIWRALRVPRTSTGQRNPRKAPS